MPSPGRQSAGGWRGCRGQLGGAEDGGGGHLDPGFDDDVPAGRQVEIGEILTDPWAKAFVPVDEDRHVGPRAKPSCCRRRGRGRAAKRWSGRRGRWRRRNCRPQAATHGESFVEVDRGALPAAALRLQRGGRPGA